jgi:hypothetical protein
LDAIPPDSSVAWGKPTPLSVWQTSGTYTVTAVTRNRFELTVYSSDFGSALLADTEYFLDHATEHQVSLWKHIHFSEWLSPAWLVVTLYGLFMYR